jgi:uncharacterized membrane protein YgcG
MPHLCFYSEKCNFSRSFIEELKKTPYISEFKFFCVDPDASGKRLAIVDKGRVEKWLNAVPTLIVDGEEAPRVDAEVFNWLSERKLRDGVKQGPSGDASSGEPAAYGNELASNKWSDSYSFFGEQFDVGKGQGIDPIPRAFAQLQEGGGFGSAMPIGHGGSSSSSGSSGSSGRGGRGGSGSSGTAGQSQQRTKKEQAMDSAFENFQKQRDNEFPSFMRK